MEQTQNDSQEELQLNKKQKTNEPTYDPLSYVRPIRYMLPGDLVQWVHRIPRLGADKPIEVKCPPEDLESTVILIKLQFEERCLVPCSKCHKVLHLITNECRFWGMASDNRSPIYMCMQCHDPNNMSQEDRVRLINLHMEIMRKGPDHSKIFLPLRELESILDKEKSGVQVPFIPNRFSMEEINDIEEQEIKKAPVIPDRSSEFCLVCHERPPTTMVLPCEHNVVCGKCSITIRESKFVHNCILCQGLITHILD
jgi:hypothetical protein